jgi:predicted ATPase/DNA-binding CsgD family transcriptional regulator
MSSVQTTENGLRGGITRRESEVLALVGERLSNREIADRLYISVRTVESHVSALLTKLGVSDRRELVGVAERIAARPAKHNLPRRPDSFVGRESVSADLAGLLRNHRLVSVVGPPGVGKTRLAIEVGRSLEPEWNSGVWLVQLAGVRDSELVVPTVMAVLGIPAGPALDPLEGLIQALGSRRTLVVLDNCEHLADAASAVAEALVTRTEDCTVLATSRHPLGVSGERVFALDPLESSAAGRLFEDRAAAAVSGFHITADIEDDVAELVQRLDGIPLALELAATRVRTFTPAEILKHLHAGLDVVATSIGDARHRTLRDAIAWSHRLLTPDARCLLERLSVFSGSFTLAAVQAVCADALLDSRQILGVLPELVDHSLVVAEQAPSGRRYHLLESVRAFASAELSGGSEIEAQHTQFFAGFADEAGSQLTGANQQRWLELVEADLDNLRVAFRRALDSGPLDLAWRLVGATMLFWEYSGRRWEGAEWARSAKALIGSEPSKLSTRAMAAAAWLLTSQDTAETLEFSQAIMDLAQQIGDEVGFHRAQLVHAWGGAHHRPREAEAALAEAAAYFARPGDRWWEALALIRLSGLEDDGAEKLTRARELCRTLGDERLYTIATRFMLMTPLVAGRLDEARGIIEEGLVLSRRTRNVHEEGEFLRYLALVELASNRPREADELYEEAVPLLLQTGDLRCASRAIAQQGVACLRSGQPGEARTLLARAWELVTKVNEPNAAAYCLSAMAEMSEGAVAVRFHAAASALIDSHQISYIPPGLDREAHQRSLRASLGPDAFDMAWNEGRAADPGALMAAPDARLTQ